MFDIQRKFESESTELFQWFNNNYLTANRGKSHAMLTTGDSLQINVKGSLLSNEKTIKLPRIQ